MNKDEKKIEVYNKLKKYAEEHNEEKIDWNNGKQQKWFMYKCSEDNKIYFSCTGYCECFGQIYFTHHFVITQALRDIGEDNIKKLFEE